MPESSSIRDEDVFFYLDLTSKKFSKKDLVKAIGDFIKQKQPLNPTGSYGVFLFEAGKTPNFTSDLTSAEDVMDLIDKQWKEREVEESYFENGLFYCLSHIATSFIRSDAKNLRVIVISDTPSNAKDVDKAQALVSLVEKVRFFPTFIDVIRVGDEKFYPDDVKLRIVTTTANGGLFYVEDEKGLRDTLVQGLVKRKSLEVLAPLGGDRYIEEEHHAFFANMASELVTPPSGENKKCSLCQGDICIHCGDPQDAPYMCPTCGTAYHDCCAARYSLKNHIGIKYIFRCPNCTSLVKVSQDSIAAAELIPSTPDAQIFDKGLLQEIMGPDPYLTSENAGEEALQDHSQTEVGHTPDSGPLAGDLPQNELQKESPSEPSETRYVPAGGTGFFWRAKPAAKQGNNGSHPTGDKHETWTPPSPELAPPGTATGGSDLPLKPVPRKTGLRVLVCPICGQSLPQRSARCPNCQSIVPGT